MLYVWSFILYRAVLIGPAMAGKTSLMKSLIAGESKLTNMEDRTCVVDFITWKICNTDKIRFVDQGGQRIYQIINPYFISPRSTVLVHQDVNRCDNVQEIESFVRTTMYQHPENEIEAVLTKIDQCEDKSKVIEGTKERCKAMLQKEIKNLNKVLKKSDSSYSENIKHMCTMFTKKLETMQYFAVSSDTCEGIESLRKSFENKAKQARTEVPDIWMICFDIMIETNKKFWHRNDFLKCYQEQSTVDKDDTSCLRYLNEAGFVMWHQDHPLLSQYIFCDMEFIVDVFRSIFDHKMSAEHFDDNEEIQEYFDVEEEFHEMLLDYQCKGLLAHKLLTFLLHVHKLEMKMESIIVELIKQFHVFNEIEAHPRKVNQNVYFVPWLVKNNETPQNLDINNPMYIDHNTLTLCIKYQFYNSIPINLTEMGCVELLKYAVEKGYIGNRYTWSDGIKLCLAYSEVFLYRHSVNDTHFIYLCTRGPVDHLEDHWIHLKALYSKFEALMNPWNGIVRSKHSICAHCAIRGYESPHKWLVKYVFPEMPTHKVVHCKLDDKPIPAALVNWQQGDIFVILL